MTVQVSSMWTEPQRKDGGETYVLDESTLVLEGVTLAQVVELVVKVLVDLAGGTVADEQTTEDTHAAHPQDLAKFQKRHPLARYDSLQHVTQKSPFRMSRSKT